MAGTNEQQTAGGNKMRAVFHIAVTEQGDVWTRVCVAFNNRDGSQNVLLTRPLPTGGKLHIRDEKPFRKAA